MDIQYLLLLQQLREATGGALDGLMLLITELGHAAGMVLPIALVYWCVDKRVGEYLAFNALLGKVLNDALKVTACVLRPWLRDARVQPQPQAIHAASGYSFPSGHTTIAAAVWGGLAVQYRRRRWLSAVFGAVWLLVAFSRNYLGVHTPQDVAVASAIGAALLWASLWLERWVNAAPGRVGWLALGAVAAGAALMLYAGCKSYPLVYGADGALLADPATLREDAFATGGGAVAFGAGFWAERRWVRFTVEGSLAGRAVRYLAGLALVGAVYVGGGALAGALLPAAAAAAVQMAAVVLTMLVAYPWLFSRAGALWRARRAQR